MVLRSISNEGGEENDALGPMGVGPRSCRSTLRSPRLREEDDDGDDDGDGEAETQTAVPEGTVVDDRYDNDRSEGPGQPDENETVGEF
mmetsp:Transcript_23111/g.44015  ORF Transcript_23111/g.44015 Transcript_23111/m.44015 type:complete len:88 (+) Transcript_23111:88-351(+)